MVARRTTAEAVSPSTCACRSIAVALGDNGRKRWPAYKLGLRRAPQSLDSLRDDDYPQRKRADCECYGDQRCCRIDALPHNRGCDCCRVLLLTR
jgi:hypothetical protein